MGSVGLGVISRLLAIATSILLARALGPEAYGVYAFVIAVVTLLAIPVQLGLPNLVFRLVSVYEHDADWPRLRGLLRWANIWTGGLGVLVLAAGGVALLSFPLLPTRMPVEPLLWGLGLVPLLGLSAVRSAVLRGLRRVVTSQVPEGLVQPMLLPLLVVAAILINGFVTLDATRAIQFNLVATIAGFLVGVTLLRRCLPRDVRTVPARMASKAWTWAALPFFLSFGAHLLLKNTDVVMLGILTTPEDTGVYRVASQAALLTAFFAGIVHPLIGPYLARFHRAGEQRRLQQIVTIGSWVGTLGALPLVVLYFVAGESLLEILFGEVYTHGYHSLLILVGSHFLYSLMAPVGPLLGMTGHAWYTTLAILAAAILNVGLNFVLVPKLGIEGAAVATLCSVLVMHVMLAVFAYRCTGANVFKFWPLERLG